MRKQTAAALALVTIPALAGAATLQDTATAGTTTYTKHLRLHETASHDLGKTHFVGTDKAWSRASGNVVGFDTFTGRFDPKTKTLFVQAAFAFKGGLLLVRAHSVGDNHFRGRVIGGTGAFREAQGTLAARGVGHGNMVVTLKYTL